MTRGRVFAALGVMAMAGGLAFSCAGNADKDSDGYFGDTALCGGPMFDCNEDDRSVGNGKVFFCDVDLDGFGDPGRTLYLCDEVACDELPCTAVTNSMDCDDSDAEVTSGVPLYPDCDQDMLGDASRSHLYCPVNNEAVPETDLAGCRYVLNGDDCDDGDPLINQLRAVWPDCDNDGYGDETKTVAHVCPNTFNMPLVEGLKTCVFAERGGDCKDEEANVNPEENASANICE